MLNTKGPQETDPFTAEDLNEIRDVMYNYCVNELHLPEQKAREWADRSVTALGPDPDLAFGRSGG